MTTTQPRRRTRSQPVARPGASATVHASAHARAHVRANHLASSKADPSAHARAHPNAGARFGPGPSSRAGPPRCPECGDHEVVLWGRFATRHGPRQRYRCRRCTRTFSEQTGAPFASLKKSHLWGQYCDCVRASMTVRHAARSIGIHRDTAFRWRHRLLAALRSGTYAIPSSPAAGATILTGPVLLAEMWFFHSEKGKRPLGRAPYRNDWTVDWLNAPRAWVILAGESSGFVWSDVVGMQRPMADDLERVLGPALAPGTTLVTRQGPYGPIHAFARRAGLRYRRLDQGPVALRYRGAPLPDLGAYMRRLRRWLRRFCGVATRYLPNYLAWHRLVEADRASQIGVGAPS
jgi:transposase-like protein